MDYGVVRLARSVCERRFDVICLQIRKVAQDLFVGGTFRQHSQNIGDPDSQAPDARPPATFAWFHCDALQKFHGSTMQQLRDKINLWLR
jgi:hypothetical protein